MHTRTTLVAVLLVATLAATGPVGGTSHAGTAAVTDTCTYPVTVGDATGTAVTVTAEPTRVVTLNPSAAQTMWALGAADRVVGVSKYARYLPGADEKANVSGSGATFNTERIVSLRPDLVLAPNTIPNETVGNLRRLGLTVYRFRGVTNVDGVAEKTRRIGRLTGECRDAERTVAWMDRNVAAAREARAGRERPRVLYTFYGYSVSNGSYIHDMLTTAGGRNVYAGADAAYPQVNAEYVLARDPEVLVLNDDDASHPTSSVYDDTTAGRNDRVVVVEKQYLNQPAPYSVVYGVRNLTEGFYPDVDVPAVPRSAVDAPTTAAETTTRATRTAGQASADASTTPGRPTTTTEPTTSETETPETTPPTAAPGQSGFGPLASLAGVTALLALIAARRGR